MPFGRFRRITWDLPMVSREGWTELPKTLRRFPWKKKKSHLSQSTDGILERNQQNPQNAKPTLKPNRFAVVL